MPAWTRKEASVRRAEILAAAERLLGRHGTERFSLSTIADEARLSKAAIYMHFESKEDLFRALTLRVLEQPMVRAQEAAKAEGELASRVFEMLWTKVGHFYRISRESGHGHTLIDSATSLAADIIAEDRKAYVRLLTRVLADAEKSGSIDPSRFGLTAKGVAETFIAAAHGLARRDAQFVSERIYAQRLRGLVGAMLAGLQVR
jgi:AcrR family transcriptional regulator